MNKFKRFKVCDDKTAAVVAAEVNGTFEEYGMYIDGGPTKSVIIGNKFENPDLLTKKNNG